MYFVCGILVLFFCKALICGVVKKPTELLVMILVIKRLCCQKLVLCLLMVRDCLFRVA